jgi:hypothetical protein
LLKYRTSIKAATVVAKPSDATQACRAAGNSVFCAPAARAKELCHFTPVRKNGYTYVRQPRVCAAFFSNVIKTTPMAVLQSGNLSFEFQFVNFENGYITYHLFLLWQGQPVMNSEILKRGNDYRNNYGKSGFIADEFRGDRFVPFLRRILEEDKADYWQSLDPDVTVAIYPDEYFPFLESHWVIIHESEKLRQEREAQIQRKKEQGKLPDDSYTIIVFVDAYNFKGENVYQGDGFSLQMIVDRASLEAFADALTDEYEEFKKEFGIDEWSAEND